MCVDGIGLTHVLGRPVGMNLDGMITPVDPGIVMTFDDGTVDGNKAPGIVTGLGPNVSGIGNVGDTGGGVGIVTIDETGTDDGTDQTGIITPPLLGKITTQASLGAWLSGITTPPVGMAVNGGKIDEITGDGETGVGEIWLCGIVTTTDDGNESGKAVIGRITMLG